MLVAATLALFASQASSATLTVADFFPVDAGSVWTYKDTINKVDSICEDQVVGAAEINGQTTYGIRSRIDDRNFETTYYRLDKEKVMLIGFDLKEPLTKPYPVVVMANGGVQKWSHVGDTMIFDERAPLQMDCSSKMLYSFSYKGEKLPALEVTIKGTVDMDSRAAVKSEQVAVYAKGIGLVRLRETGSFGKQKFTRIRELVSYRIGPEK
ncbi:MAG: hypothetical protein JNJ45_09430 [Chthonomonas sp.]|nr:hypothetical protein [Chthonomonas sp.]